MDAITFNDDDTVTVRLSDLMALASAVVHADEGRGPTGHVADWQAFESNATAARPILDRLDQLALLPVRRTP
jgi:hypothetical protein